MSKILKPAETAQALNVSTETLRSYAEAGRIPFVSTPGGHRRYVLEDVLHALAMARSERFEPLRDGEPSRLAAVIPAQPIRRAPRWQASPIGSLIADAGSSAAASARELQIPFIGAPGTGRFVVGPRAVAR
jgi:excisionase family DNA binding protein